MTVDRDRDAAGRARSSRPRDDFGRPLPYGATGVTRVPDDLRLPPGEAVVEAQRYLDEGHPFQAHEVLEASWKSAPDDERALWRALAQVCVGLTHAQRGNRPGPRPCSAVVPPDCLATPAPARTASPSTGSPPRLRHGLRTRQPSGRCASRGNHRQGGRVRPGRPLDVDARAEHHVEVLCMCLDSQRRTDLPDRSTSHEEARPEAGGKQVAGRLPRIAGVESSGWRRSPCGPSETITAATLADGTAGMPEV